MGWRIPKLGAFSPYLSCLQTSPLQRGDDDSLGPLCQPYTNNNWKYCGKRFLQDPHEQQFGVQHPLHRMNTPFVSQPQDLRELFTITTSLHVLVLWRILRPRDIRQQCHIWLESTPPQISSEQITYQLDPILVMIRVWSGRVCI